ncbi:hypothetical protein BC828DRAFT_402358 [Blastocladiella britannica]|nr:hypothetical protein BC828DRAFT_402358 [Blastocladiella britannica]
MKRRLDALQSSRPADDDTDTGTTPASKRLRASPRPLPSVLLRPILPRIRQLQAALGVHDNSPPITDALVKDLITAALARLFPKTQHGVESIHTAFVALLAVLPPWQVSSEPLLDRFTPRSTQWVALAESLATNMTRFPVLAALLRVCPPPSAALAALGTNLASYWQARAPNSNPTPLLSLTTALLQRNASFLALAADPQRTNAIALGLSEVVHYASARLVSPPAPDFSRVMDAALQALDALVLLFKQVMAHGMALPAAATDPEWIRRMCVPLAAMRTVPRDPPEMLDAATRLAPSALNLLVVVCSETARSSDRARRAAIANAHIDIVGAVCAVLVTTVLNPRPAANLLAQHSVGMFHAGCKMLRVCLPLSPAAPMLAIDRGLVSALIVLFTTLFSMSSGTTYAPPTSSRPSTGEPSSLSATIPLYDFDLAVVVLRLLVYLNQWPAAARPALASSTVLPGFLDALAASMTLPVRSTPGALHCILVRRDPARTPVELKRTLLDKALKLATQLIGMDLVAAHFGQDADQLTAFAETATNAATAAAPVVPAPVAVTPEKDALEPGEITSVATAAHGTGSDVALWAVFLRKLAENALVRMKIRTGPAARAGLWAMAVAALLRSAFSNVPSVQLPYSEQSFALTLKPPPLPADAGTNPIVGNIALLIKQFGDDPRTLALFAHYAGPLVALRLALELHAGSNGAPMSATHQLAEMLSASPAWTAGLPITGTRSAGPTPPALATAIFAALPATDEWARRVLGLWFRHAAEPVVVLHAVLEALMLLPRGISDEWWTRRIAELYVAHAAVAKQAEGTWLGRVMSVAAAMVNADVMAPPAWPLLQSPDTFGAVVGTAVIALMMGDWPYHYPSAPAAVTPPPPSLSRMGCPHNSAPTSCVTLVAGISNSGDDFDQESNDLSASVSMCRTCAVGISPWFNALLGTDFAESGMSRFVLDDCSAPTLHDFLHLAMGTADWVLAFPPLDIDPRPWIARILDVAVLADRVLTLPILSFLREVLVSAVNQHSPHVADAVPAPPVPAATFSNFATTTDGHMSSTEGAAATAEWSPVYEQMSPPPPPPLFVGEPIPPLTPPLAKEVIVRRHSYCLRMALAMADLLVLGRHAPAALVPSLDPVRWAILLKLASNGPTLAQNPEEVPRSLVEWALQYPAVLMSATATSDDPS